MRMITIFVFLSMSHAVFSTSIVILKTNNTIYAAADSRSTIRIRKDKSEVDSFITICKIHVTNDVFFAVSGHDDMGTALLADHYLSKYKNLDSAINAFVGAREQMYLSVMEFHKRTNLQLFKYYVEKGLGSISFFGFKKKTPFLITIYFLYNEQGQSKVNHLIDKKSNRAFLGNNDHIFNLSDKQIQERFPDKRSMVFIAEKMVRYEMSKHQKAIAEPIDLLLLNTTKANWIRKHKCEPLEHMKKRYLESLTTR